jgi:hypothetical protein
MMNRSQWAGLALAWMIAPAALAEPSDYVLQPRVVEGERAIELKMGTADGPDTRESAGSVSLEYSPTSFWVTEIYAAFARSGGDPTHYDAIEWENRFQLTEPGQYAVDWGLAAEIEKPQDAREGWHTTIGPLLQGMLTDRVQWNFNPLLSRYWRAETPAKTELEYQLQFKVRYRRSLEFGLQGFGKFGPWYHWSGIDAQTHNLGPAVFASWPLGGRQSVYVNAAWLFGMTSATASNTLRAQLEFEF